MNVIVNKQNTDAYIYNIAFIKAIFIKEYIKSLSLTKDEKEQILKSTLQLLKSD